MRLLLDTHVLLWWLEDAPRLSEPQTRALERAEADGEALAVAAISLWEIAKLAEIGRIRPSRTIDAVLDQIEQHPAIEVVPLNARVALESTRLSDRLPKDPADQLIIATARVHGLRLVTADQRIRDSHVVSVV